MPAYWRPDEKSLRVLRAAVGLGIISYCTYQPSKSKQCDEQMN
jgi:hypothetical protein